MTFLEYCCERLLGPPASRGCDGRSYWNCPFHNDTNPSFCTLPSKPEYKDRFQCFGCGAWGDEFDLMKRFFDNENFADRRARLDQWREDFRREHPAEQAGSYSPRTGSSRTMIAPGVTLLRRLLAEKRIDGDDLLEVLGELRHQREVIDEFLKLGRRPVVERWLKKQGNGNERKKAAPASPRKRRRSGKLTKPAKGK